MMEYVRKIYIHTGLCKGQGQWIESGVYEVTYLLPSKFNSFIR